MRSNYLWYQFFRYGIIRPSLNLFYSKITVNKPHPLPENKPVMFVANHQNSFLDALHVTNSTSHIVHFLARAEAFGNPLLDRFFYSLNMLPVYRARDGFGTIKRNEDIFEECYERFAQNDAILVFAEASHKIIRRVRTLSKGFTRIVFGAEEKYNWDLDIQIVPVGVSYGNHRKSRTPVRVDFGKVVPVSDYQQAYYKDDRKAALQLKEDIEEQLKKLTLHIPSEQNYALYELLLDELEPNRDELLHPQLVNNRVNKIENSLTDKYVEDSEFILKKAEQHDVDILKDIIATPSAGLKDILLSPLYAFSLLVNAVPYQVVRWFVNSYLEDEAFESSVKFLIGLLLPFYYLLIAMGLFWAGTSIMLSVGFMLLSLATAPLFVRAKDLLKAKLFGRKKTSSLLKNDKFKKRLKKFTELRKSLFNDKKLEKEQSIKI